MTQSILEMSNIRKVFGNVIANDNINLKVLKGEIHAIVGENGAGKSTLMKILNGLYQPDTGKIVFHGKEVKITGPGEAARLGIGMVYQHFMLVSTLTVAENMVLGVEPKKGVFLDIEKAKKEVREVSEKYGLKIDPDAKISELSVGMQQRVEIIKILFKGAELLVFDEPTAVLTPQEVKELYKIMKKLIDEGKTIIFITHKLQEVLDTADNITVIRAGRNVGEMRVAEATKEKIANCMVGRKVLFNLDRKEVKKGNKIVEIENLYVKNDKGMEAVKGISLDIHEGEILGIAGVEGNGQTELVEALTGLRAVEKGKAQLYGKDMVNLSPREITRNGVAHIPEDRHKRAAVSEYSISHNLALGVHREKYSKGIMLDYKKMNADAAELLEKYDIRPREIGAVFGRLSGGNQQKVIVARELEKEHRFFIASQPTRGVDIGAIESIHAMILKEREEKKAVLVVSAELSEIMSLSDRIAVMYEGKVAGILTREEATEERLGILMAGGKI